MSPEQARAEELDARTDIWSVGVILYEILAHQQPFGGTTPADIRDSILTQKVPALSSDLPGEVGTIIEKSLRKDRDDRYQNVQAMLSDLRAFKGTRGTLRLRTSQIRRHRVSSQQIVCMVWEALTLF